MDANERIILRALSFFGSPATLEALLATAKIQHTWLNRIEMIIHWGRRISRESFERRALDAALKRLRALSMVDTFEDIEGKDRFTIHPLTRKYARRDLILNVDVERAMGMQFARYWMRFAAENCCNYNTYDRLEVEWGNLRAAANWLWETARVCDDSIKDKGAARMLNSLAGSLADFLWFSGNWDEHIQLSSRAYETVRLLKDWSSAGWRAYEVFWIHLHRGCIDELALWKDRCVDAWASSDDKNNQAERLRVNGIFAGEHKNHDKANQLLENALGVWCDLRQSRSIAAVLGDLGNLAHVRQEFDTAELRYHGALEAMQETKDKEGIADYSGRLGRLAHARSQWMEARRWFEQELMLGKEVNRLDLIAHAQYGLARVHEAEGHADLALPLAQDALKIYERLQHRDLAEARELVERLQKAGGSKQ